MLPDFAQKHVYLHFHGRGGPDREDADLKAIAVRAFKQGGKRNRFRRFWSGKGGDPEGEHQAFVDKMQKELFIIPAR